MLTKIEELLQEVDQLTAQKTSWKRSASST